MAGGERKRDGDNSIRLTVPADPAYGRVARTAVAGLALRMGFAYSAIEDLGLAVDELLILLLRPEVEPGTVTLVFRPSANGLTIDARTSAGGSQPWIDTPARDRFERLVASNVDTCEIDEDSRSVRLVKEMR